MAEFEPAVKIILQHEGGFVDHPSDPGGATNRGITFQLFKQYATSLQLSKTVEALKGLTEDQAKFIYREHFWDKMQGNRFLNQQVANLVFDGFVNMGANGIKTFQRAIGAVADGVVGSGTLIAINSAAPSIAFDQIKEQRIKFYNDLVVRKPKLQVFLKGWLNRVNSFVYKVS